MGKVNILLKRSYTCVISVLVIIAFLLLGLTLYVHGGSTRHHPREDEAFVLGLHFMYGFSAVILILALIGGFGIWKERKWALIVFAVGMILGCLFFIVTKILYFAALSKMKSILKDQYLSMLPLSNLSESDLLDLNLAQTKFHCCGLTSSNDWENNIPESCQCDESSTDLCEDSSGHVDNFQGLFNTKPNRIYAKPCLPFLIQRELHYSHIGLGILLGFILLWILSIGLSIAILCQMNKKVETPKVVYSPEAKAGNYSSLTEALEDG